MPSLRTTWQKKLNKDTYFLLSDNKDILKKYIWKHFQVKKSWNTYGMSGDPSSCMVSVIKATLSGSNVNLIIDIFHLVLHIEKRFEQRDIDYETQKKWYVSL